MHDQNSAFSGTNGSDFPVSNNSSVLLLLHLVRDTSGFSGYDREILGLTLSFYLTIMVHFLESNPYRGAQSHPGDQALALRTQPMATTLVSVDTREVVRCDYCKLVQYRTVNSLCRKCHKPLDIEEPVPAGPVIVAFTRLNRRQKPVCRLPARSATSESLAT